MNTFYDMIASSELLNLWIVTAAKGLAILALVTLVCMALSRASASLRHLCWGLGMIALLILPALSILLPQWNLAFIPEPVAAEMEGNIAATMTAGESAYVISNGSDHAVSTGSAPVVSSGSSPSASNGRAPEASYGSTPTVWEDPAAAAVDLTAHASEDLSGAAAVDLTARVARDASGAAPAAEAPLVKASVTPWYASLSAFEWLLVVWLAGVAVLLSHMLICSLIMQRLVTKAHPVSDPEWLDMLEEMSDRLMIRRPVHLLQSDRITVPLVWGTVRPVVILPDGASDWTVKRSRCVLAHELAHIRRWDTLTHTAAHLACVVHWYNPLAWRAASGMQLEREKACDDLVLRMAKARASEYASHLLEIARNLPGSRSIPAGALAMARPSQLEGRVLSILDGGRRRTLARPSALATILLAVLILIPIAAMSPFGAAKVIEPEWAVEESPEPESVTVNPLRERIESAARAAASGIAARVSAVADETLNAKSNGTSSQHQDDVQRTFQVADDGWLMIDTDHGNIDVEAGTPGEIDVTVRRTPRGSAEASDFDVSFEQVGDKVSIRGENLIRNSGRNSVNVTFVVKVPPRFNVDFETSGGNISLDDLDGRAKLNTSGGNLSIGTVTGQVDAKTSGGNISVDGSNADVDVNTSGGNIQIGEVGGMVRATTSGGNISVDEVNGDLTARTSGGQITARLATQPQGRSILQTSGGGITVYLAEEISVNLEAETSAGRVHSDVDVTVQGEIKKDRLRGTINGGGPVLELDTSAGDIHIRRL